MSSFIVSGLHSSASAYVIIWEE